MSKTTKSTKEELRVKLQNKINQKKIGRMSREVQKKQLDEYCKEIGIKPEDLEKLQKSVRNMKK